MIVCYIISTHYKTFYTGITNSLIRRWKEHVSGQSAYLSKVAPKEVVYVKFCETRKQAARLEKHVKRIGARKFLLKVQFEGDIVL